MKSIRFENINLLASVVSKVSCVHQSDVGLNDANSCILIQQPNFSKTVFTCVTPSRSIVQRFYLHEGDHSGGTENLEFLVLSKDFQDKVSRMKKNASALSLKGVKNGLQISGQVIEGGKTVTKHRLVAKQYAGLNSDFYKVFTGNDFIAELKSEDFNFLVSCLLDFGGFTTEKQFDSDIVTGAVHLEFKDGKLAGTTRNTKKCNQAHIQVTVDCKVTKELDLNIEGYNLKALKDLSVNAPVMVSVTKEPVNGEMWISFTGQFGVVTLRQVSSNINKYRKVGLFEPTDSEKVKNSSIRCCDLAEFEGCIEVQCPTDLNNTLLLTEEKPRLQIQDSQDLGANEFSLVDLSTDIVIGDWISYLINQDALTLACRAFRDLRAHAQAEDFKLVLVQRSIIKSANKQSPVILITPHLSYSKGDVKFLTTANIAEDSVQDMNTKD